MNAPRSRPPANTPRTLAHFLLYLRRTISDEMGRPVLTTQGQLAQKLGYRSASVISELEAPEKCRAAYEHLERYADYFGVPAGVMLLITRITAATKYGSGGFNAASEIDAIRKGLLALLGNLEPGPDGVPAVLHLIQRDEAHDPVAWERVFERLLTDFRQNLDDPHIFRRSSARRVRSPTRQPVSRVRKRRTPASLGGRP